MSFRIDAVVATEAPPLAVRHIEVPSAGSTRSRAVFVRGKGRIETAIYDFGTLPAGSDITGPAVIERDMTTIWVPPGAMAALDDYGNLHIQPEV